MKTETMRHELSRLSVELRQANKRSAYWCDELQKADKDIAKLESVVENLVDDIAGLKGRTGKDRDRAILFCNSWFSVVRARSLLGKDKV